MRVLFVFLLVFSVSSCFLIKDFGSYWDDGIVDPDLEGKWVSTKDSKKIMNFKKKDDYYIQDGTANIMKTLVLADDKFMMIIDKGKGKNSINMLMSYTVKDNEFIIYQFRQDLYDKIEKQIGDHSSQVKSGKISAIQVNALTPEFLDSLAKLVKDRQYWVDIAVFKKAVN